MVDTAGERRGVVRDRLVDGGLVVLAAVAGLGPAVYWFETAPLQADWLRYLDYVAGVLGCLALWWRRRFPLALASALVLMSAFSLSAGAAALVALLTVAVHSSARATAVVAAGNVLSIVVFTLLRPGPVPFSWMLVALQAAIVVGLAGWGLLVRSRRQLIASLRERAAAAEVEARLRAERSQHEAREALAREMHDVLGHRCLGR
jgi:signal transduction histidine kinase